MLFACSLMIAMGGFNPSIVWAQAETPASVLIETRGGSESVERLLPVDWPLSGLFSDELGDRLGVLAPIYLDGRVVFYVSAPAVEGQGVEGPYPAEVRAKAIQDRLNKFATNQLTNDQQVRIVIDEPTQLPIITVDDEQLLTVTNLDAQLGGYARPSQYAIAFKSDIEAALDRYREERQPTFIRRQARIGAVIVVVALLVLLGCDRLVKHLKRKQAVYRKKDTQLGQATRLSRPPLLESALLNRVDSVFDLLKAQLDNRQRRKLNEAAIALLLLLRAGVVMGGVLWIMALFPYSRWLTTLLLYWMSVPARILLIAGIAYGVLRLVSLIVDRVSLALQEGAQWAPEASARLSLRFFTFSQVAKGVAGSVIFATMVLAMLATAGIQVGPLLAGAGIIGVGISLAAQSLIKDIINGFLILLEDHFGIGDVIAIDEGKGVVGTVETINLRITQLRNTEGRLITVPNSQIGIVQNLSKDWSQVDLSVTVAPTTDIPTALSLFESVTATMATEDTWQQQILEPPELLGVEAVDSTGITLRLFLKTQPLKQWVVARELRQRLKVAFDEAGIRIGVPREQLEILRKEDGEFWEVGSGELGDGE
ncbi:MAG: mechanosensitive ion channel family protein [Cyanobacteria bacterium J06588_5]